MKATRRNRRRTIGTALGFEVRQAEVLRVRADIRRSKPVTTGGAVLLDMLSNCNVPGFYPHATNIFGRHVPANIEGYEQVQKVLKQILSENDRTSSAELQKLADAYLYMGYMFGNGIRRAKSQQVHVRDMIYYVHSKRGRGINLYEKPEESPASRYDPIVALLNRRSLFPATAEQSVAIMVGEGAGYEATASVRNFGERVSEFGSDMLRLCKAVPSDRNK